MISDYPFKGQVKYMTAKLTGDDYEAAIVTVMNRVNYNEVQFYNPLSWLGYIRYDQVEVIMNSYYNLVDSGAREYSSSDALQGETTVWTLIKAVAVTSGQTEELTRKVLDQLEFATADGSVKSAQYIKPKTFQTFQVTRSKPDAVQTASGWLASNILWIAVLGTGIYVAKKTGLLDKGFSAVKKKVLGDKGLNDRHKRHRLKKSNLSDDLFGSDYDDKIFWKAGNEIGIASRSNLPKLREKYAPTTVKIMFHSPNYEEVKQAMEKHTHTSSLFDKRTKRRAK